MRDDDTIPAGMPEATSGDATIVAPRDTPIPRVRPSRPTLPPSSANYATLQVVDPAHYVLLREIARGGMGRVMVARDRRLGREVALKEVLVESAAMARRFEREARITARLQHPAIISVHEAGVWPSREPFYAMRLVTGRSLDEVIDATPAASERLALLPHVLAVADAMAYAHRERVIHRDLKPSNIVVGEFGETVVLDWGLAKDLDSADVSDGAGEPPPIAAREGSAPGETTLGEVIGTPTYMPPEQAHGEAVDERADVYAIGAILYRTLAGRPPFAGESAAAVLAQVVIGDPTPLRAHVPDVAGELVAIVERAMARDAAARYPTARDLAEDLRRFQTGKLVGAHRYSLRQLLARWVRRHRTVLVAAAVAAVVAIGIGVVAIRRVVAAEALAQDERAQALANRKDAEELMQFMLVDLEAKLEPVGKLDLLDAVARRASAYYDARGAAGGDEDAYLQAIARVGVAKVMEARGDLPGARGELTRAQGELDRITAAHPDDARYRHHAIEAGGLLAAATATGGDLPGALALDRALAERAKAAVDAHPDDAIAVHDLYAVHRRMGSVLDHQGELHAALDEARTVLALADRRAALDPGTAADKDLLNAHAEVGRMLARAAHDSDGALAEYRLGLAFAERLAQREPGAPMWMQDVAVSHEDVGFELMDRKDIAGGLAELRLAIVEMDRAIAIDPTNASMVSTRATISEKVGIALLAQHDLAGATAEFRACEATWRTLTERDPSNLDWMRGRSMIENKLGDVQLAAQDVPGALASYRGALAIRDRMVDKDPSNAMWRRDQFYSHYKLAGAHRAAHDRAQTIAELRAAIAIAAATLAAHPDNASSAEDAEGVHAELGDELAAAGDPAGAAAEYQLAEDIAQRMAGLPNADPDWTKIVTKLAGKRAALGAKR